MELVKREDLPQVELRTERVTVETLGGDVIVRGRMLADTLCLASMRADLVQPKDGEPEADTQMRAGAEYAAQVLAIQVVAEDEKPLMTARAWSVWGGSNYADFARLYEAAQRVSGDKAEAVEKN